MAEAYQTTTSERTVLSEHGPEVALRTHIYEIYAGASKDIGDLSTDGIVDDLDAIYQWIKTGKIASDETGEDTDTDTDTVG